MIIELLSKSGPRPGPWRRKILIFATCLRAIACPLILTGQGVAPAPVQINANTNFTLLVSGGGTLAPIRTARSLQPGRKCALLAVPAKGSVFAGWFSNSIMVASTPRYAFTAESNMVLQADFLPSPFTSAAGNYYGLFYVTNNAAPESSGSFDAMVGGGGNHTARLRLGGGSYPLSGTFSLTGAASNSIARPGLARLLVNLQLDMSNGPLTGTVSDGTWTADLAANPAVYSKTNPAPQAGKYTLLIPGGDNGAIAPGGNGFGAVTVSETGAVTFNGMLGDGTPVTAASMVSSDGQWPLYASLLWRERFDSGLALLHQRRRHHRPDRLVQIAGDQDKALFRRLHQ